MTDAELFKTLSERLALGLPTALVTVVSCSGSVPRSAGTKMLVFPDGTIRGTIGGGRFEALAAADAARALADGRSASFSYELEPKELGMYCGGRAEVFVDALRDPLRLVILGGGHVGRKLAALCAFMGVPYSVVDDRPEYARPEDFPSARSVSCEQPDQALKRLAVGPETAVAIVTRCHGFDLRCLAAALGTPAFYVGMIGSRKKAESLFELCRRRGLDPDEPRVRSPIGLDLGGESPEAIALSILAEILQIKHGAGGRPLSQAALLQET